MLTLDKKVVHSRTAKITMTTPFGPQIVALPIVRTDSNCFRKLSEVSGETTIFL